MSVENAEKRRTSILVVDDEPKVREIFQHYLEEDGHEVSLAADGDEALRVAAAKKFDVALLDLVMPGKEGFETIGELKSIDPDLTVIVVSGYVGDSDSIYLEMARELGADLALPKPISSLDLKNAVRDFLIT